ncbi:MAG: hypothetical protein HUK20_06455 [Fibrobacter sp.]|nr:hypothetical protein [Fibrobacter sp.]
MLFINMSFASIDASLGAGPSRGMLSFGYSFYGDRVSTNIHFPFYDSDYDFIGGVGVGYHFFGKTGPYAFHTSEWINGTIQGFSCTYDKDGVTISELVETSKDINYWRLIFGMGYQHMFTTYFGAYFEVGFEFYAGDGSYYTHFDRDMATLDNEELVFPIGFGLAFSF